MKKMELKLRKSLRTIFHGISFTAIAFVFQACYGTAGDFGSDIKVSGTVKSKTTNLPIKGIKVSHPNSMTYEITDENGNFSFYTYMEYNSSNNDIPVLFEDIDGIENGYFEDKTIIIDPARKDEIKINVELEEKQ